MKTGDVFQTAAGGFFQVPFARNWFALIGIMPADKHRIVAKLRNKDHVRPLILAQLTYSSPSNFGTAIRVCSFAYNTSDVG